MASAKALLRLNEKAKAIDAYEKAILDATDEDKKNAASEELNSIGGWRESPWVAPFVGQLQSIWVWFPLVFIVFPSILLGRRIFWWLICQTPLGKDRCRVMITPVTEGEFAAYFRELVRRAHDSMENQRHLMRRIADWNATTVVPTFRSTSLLAALPFSLPTVFASKWWSPFAGAVANAVDPPAYTVDLAILHMSNRFGVSVRLSARGTFIDHWHTSCADEDIPEVLGNTAYAVVAQINNHRSRTT